MSRRRLVRGSPHKDIKVEYAATDGVEMLRHVADDFINEIFDPKPPDYVIKDESRLRDFADFGVSSTRPVWKRIKHSYAIDSDDVESERLVDIVQAIERRQHYQ